MLHILLVILKTAGIILGVVLLLAAVLIGAVLLVPLRYRIEGRCGPKEKDAALSVTWFGRLIRVQARASAEKGVAVEARAAWITLLRFPKGKDGSGRKKKIAGRPPKSGAAAKKRREKPGEKAARSTGAVDAEREIRAEHPARREEAKGPAAQGVPTRSAGPEKTENEVRADSGEGRIRGLLTALWEKGKALFHFLAALPEKIRQCRERVLGFFRKLKEIGSRWRKLREKISWYLEIWKEEETQRLLKAGMEHLRYLWRHYRPRRSEGFLRFGFPDPSVTGQAAGVLYLIFSNPGNTITLCPEFSTDVIIGEGELMIKGRIRLIHLVRTGFSLFRNQDLRHFLRRIREK